MLIPCSSALFIQGAWAGFSFPTTMTWVDQESLVTSMVRLYAVSAVILAIIMGILTPVHYAFEHLF